MLIWKLFITSVEYFFTIYPECSTILANDTAVQCSVWTCVCASWHECSHTPPDDCPAYGAVAQTGCAVSADDQVATGDEDHRDEFVHADLTGPLFLKLSQLFLWTQVWSHWKTHTNAQVRTFQISLGQLRWLIVWSVSSQRLLDGEKIKIYPNTHTHTHYKYNESVLIWTFLPVWDLRSWCTLPLHSLWGNKPSTC